MRTRAPLAATSFLLLLLLALGAGAAQPREHVVAPGDTLFGLALRYDVAVAELRALNELSGDLLQIGATLRLPGPDGWSTYEVPEGHGWNEVAAAVDRSAETLRAANPALSDAAGATVRVPPGEGPLVAPRPAEDLLAFAARIGASPGAVVARNGLEPPYRLDPAEPLLLPDTAVAFGTGPPGAEAPGATTAGAAESGARPTGTSAPGVGATGGPGPSAAAPVDAHAALRLTALRALPDHLAGVRLRPPDDGFRWPLAIAPRITSRFGWRAVSVAGNRYHQGLDLGAPTGTPVLAARDGVVHRTGWIGAYGYAVYLRHEDGFETRYAHLSRIDVATGARVGRGDRIGAVGTTGASTGPHLHFEVRRDGRALDPLTLLPEPGGGGIAAR